MSDRSEPMLQMTRVVLLAALLASATPAARAAPPAARDTPTPAVPAAVPGAPGETGSASSTPAEPAPAAAAAAPAAEGATPATEGAADTRGLDQDRKSTRLNSSHRCISYAVFCLKKKTNKQ